MDVTHYKIGTNSVAVDDYIDRQFHRKIKIHLKNKGNTHLSPCGQLFQRESRVLASYYGRGVKITCVFDKEGNSTAN